MTQARGPCRLSNGQSRSACSGSIRPSGAGDHPAAATRVAQRRRSGTPVPGVFPAAHQFRHDPGPYHQSGLGRQSRRAPLAKSRPFSPRMKFSAGKDPRLRAAGRGLRLHAAIIARLHACIATSLHALMLPCM
jgi:hypothetical protein